MTCFIHKMIFVLDVDKILYRRMPRVTPHTLVDGVRRLGDPYCDKELR